MGNSYTSRAAGAPFEFELDGEAFVCGGGVSFLDLAEMARLADLDGATAEGMVAIADLFRGALGREDYDRLQRHIRAHHTDPDTLVEIMRDMVTHVVGPTGRSGSLSPGPTNTTGTYTDASPWRPSLPPQQPLTGEDIAAWRAGVARAAAQQG